MAVVRRQPDAGLVHDSDQGSQYVSHVFGQRWPQAGIDISMGAKGPALDNAACESFFGPLKKELIRQRCWPGGASRGARSSSGSRPGTTRAGCTRRSGTSHRTTTAIALAPGGDGEGSCLARRSPPKRGGPSCSARLLCHASACESRARRATWTQRPPQALLPARRPHAQAVVCQAPVRRLADKAGVERRVQPHALRHTYLAEWLARARP